MYSVVRVVRKRGGDSLLVQWLGLLASVDALAKTHAEAVWHGQKLCLVWDWRVGCGEWSQTEEVHRGTQPDQGGLTSWAQEAEGKLSHS